MRINIICLVIVSLVYSTVIFATNDYKNERWYINAISYIRVNRQIFDYPNSIKTGEYYNKRCEIEKLLVNNQMPSAQVINKLLDENSIEDKEVACVLIFLGKKYNGFTLSKVVSLFSGTNSKELTRYCFWALNTFQSEDLKVYNESIFNKIKKEKDEEIVIMGISFLGKDKTKSSSDVLIHILLNNYSKEVRYLSYAVLVGYGDDYKIKALNMLNKKKDYNFLGYINKRENEAREKSGKSGMGSH